jgi:hypothetical protein
MNLFILAAYRDTEISTDGKLLLGNTEKIPYRWWSDERILRMG